MESSPSNSRHSQLKAPYFLFGLIGGALGACLIFAILPSGGEAGAGVRRMKIAHGLPTSHPIHEGIQHFADRVAFHSGGVLRFEVFPNEQLGSATQVLEQIQTGTLEAAQVSSAVVGNFSPVARIFSLPYLFRSDAHYWEVLDGEVGEKILGSFSVNPGGRPTGFQALAYYDAGSRNFYSDRVLGTPGDLKGRKIRVMNDPVAIEMVEALGASPAPIPFGELYTALQQGVVDGAENNAPSYVLTRHFEVCKHFTMDHHSRIPDLLILSDAVWSTLSGEEREWIRLAAGESSELQRKAWAAANEKALLEMKAAGVHIHEVDPQPFVDATRSVREKHATGEIGELMEQILAVQAP